MFRPSMKTLLLTALIVSVLLSLSSSYQSMRTSKFSRYQNSESDRRVSFSSNYCKQKQNSLTAFAYKDINELNDELRKNPSKAYDMFKEQNGVMNIETAYLTLTALAQQGKSFLVVDSLLFVQR